MSAGLFSRARCAGALGLVFLAGAAAIAQTPPVLSKPPAPLDPADVQRIEQALPKQAPATPKQPRRLLIYDVNANYGGHRSIAHANVAFTRMGEKTGAFTTVISRDPTVFKPESLRTFDAVFFNNIVGNPFDDPALRQSIVEFIYSGGGMLGVHGTSVAFTRWPGAHEDWPEFGLMIGGRGANHRENTEHVFMKLDDPEHPVNRVFGGQGFDYRDEFFRVHEPYSRSRLRILASMDATKTDVNRGQTRGGCFRADNDYAVAWVRGYGRGRAFYCTIAHTPSVFWDPTMLQFYLAATQFALGDLPGPTTPSARLTPAVRAQERLGWRLGLESQRAPQPTLFDAIDRASQQGLLYLSGSSTQQISSQNTKALDDHLTDDELREIRFKLDAAGVRLLGYAVGQLPTDEPGCRRVFAFARKMGVEAIVAPAPAAQALDLAERCCKESQISLAIDAANASLENLAKLLQGRSERLGICGDAARWHASGVPPKDAVSRLGGRLVTLRLNAPPAVVGPVLEELRRQGVKPTTLALPDSTELASGLAGFNAAVLKGER